VIDLNRPDAASTAGGELVTQAEALVARLGAKPIATLGELEGAVRDRQTIGDQVKAVEEFFYPLKRLAYQLHKALCDREGAILAPLRRLDEDKRQAMTAYKAAEDRARRAREAELAEAQRQARETQAIAERDGDRAMAAAVVAEAIAAPAPVVVLPDATKTITGLKFRRVWKWRLQAGLTPAQALERIPRAYLMLDEKKLNAHAASMKESAAIAGIEFYFEDAPVR
jgi:hypothetical protein